MRIDRPEPEEPDAHRPGRADRTHLETESDRRADAGRGTDAGRGGASVSRAQQIDAHVRYQDGVDAAFRAAADRAAWAEAAPVLRAAWEDHKHAYPERIRAAPRTEPDGSWVCGDQRRLDPEQNTEATKAHADLADEADRHILPALRCVEAADPERRLAGLEHMLKGEDRLKEKLADELFGKDKMVRQALNEGKYSEVP